LPVFSVSVVDIELIRIDFTFYWSFIGLFWLEYSGHDRTALLPFGGTLPLKVASHVPDLDAIKKITIVIMGISACMDALFVGERSRD
jgi:hypothetical protein